MLDDMLLLALAKAVRLLALSHSGQHVRASLLCAWLIVLCCSVLW